MNKQEFSIYDLPDHELPLFREAPGREWVSYGFDNMYGDYLRDLYLGSAIQSAVVTGVSEMIYGEGLDATDRENTDSTKEQWLKLQRLIDGSDDKLLRMLSFDIKLYGQCYVQVIWNRVRTEIAELRHLPANSVRSGLLDAQGRVDAYFFSPDWTRMRESNFAPVKYPAYNSDDRTEAASVYQIKGYQPGVFYYGLPDYVGGTNYIELEREVSSFHLNNIKNSLFPSSLLSFSNGVPSDEERRVIEQRVNDKFSGSNNAGRLLISFSEGADTAPVLTPINPNDADGMYEFLSTESTKKILAANRITSPLLFGVRGDGSGFGNNAEELRDSFSLFQNMVVKPFQRVLLDGLQPLFSVNGINLDLYFKTLKPADFIDVEAVKVQTVEEQEKEGIEMSLSEERVEISTEATDWLIEQGEEEDDDYELIDSRAVDYALEATQDALWTFARVPSSNPNGKSEQDSFVIKVRYKYDPKETKGTTRDFCRKMVSAGKIYRKEDLLAATDKAVNPGFGPEGASTYSIWLYKGGPRCEHRWIRQTYLRKNNKKVTVGQARRIIRETDFAPPIPYNDPLVATKPKDMKNEGFINPQ